MIKFLTIVLTATIALLYYVSYHNGDNVVDFPMWKSKLYIHFDVYVKTTTAVIGCIFLYFMNKNFVHIQGTVYAFIMVLTAMFSAGLIWFTVWDGIVPNPLAKWLLVISFGFCSLYFCWPKDTDPYTLRRNNNHS